MSPAEQQETSLHDILLHHVGGDGLEALFRDARQVRFGAGEMIFGAGDPGNGVFLITAGRVEISRMSISGKKSVLAHVASGALLGEIAALDGGERSADAVAATEVLARFVARRDMMGFIIERPNLAQAVIVELCGKVRNASDMFLTQSVPEAEVRLARVLIKLFQTWGTAGDDGAPVLTERFSQQDIGEFCGLARENVSRLISAWRADGLLGKEGRKLVLLDRARLADIAEI